LVLLKLFIYLFADDGLAKLYGMDNEKGILLIGPPGCGKTTLMKLLSWLIEIEYTFSMLPTTEVAKAYTKEGHHLIKKHTHESFNGCKSKPISFCYDGLGMEKQVSYYNNPCNTMEVILRSRYDYFESDMMVTHVTTTLSTQELEQRYDLNLVRIYRMFNVISFDKASPNKRNQ
jgi:energy-coupling factor transporter ATP-binding protein EcfA2